MSPAEETAALLRELGVDSSGDLVSLSPIDGAEIGRVCVGDPKAAADCAANAFGQFRMTTQHPVVNGDRTNAGSSLEERNDLCIKDMLKRIGATPTTRRLVLRRKALLLLDTECRRPADRRLRGGDLNRMRLSILHE